MLQSNAGKISVTETCTRFSFLLRREISAVPSWPNLKMCYLPHGKYFLCLFFTTFCPAPIAVVCELHDETYHKGKLVKTRLSVSKHFQKADNEGEVCISVKILMQKDISDPNKAASRRSQRYFCQSFQRWSNSPEIGHAANKTFSCQVLDLKHGQSG